MSQKEEAIDPMPDALIQAGICVSTRTSDRRLWK